MCDMAKKMTDLEKEEYKRKIRSGEIKAESYLERWQSEGIEAYNFTPPSEEWKQRMEYLNSEEGLKLWDEAMEEDEPSKQKNNNTKTNRRK
jgi:hypothetical protein